MSLVVSLQQVLLSSPLRRAGRIVFLLASIMALLFYLVSTWQWPLIQDSAVMHYVVFLMKHGIRPYREITDNNLPGAYLVEHCAMLVFGGGDLGWRMYDFFLLAILTAALVVIAWPLDWLAGVFAGVLFALQHGSDGMWFTAEREQEMTVLLAVSCALLFLAVRRKIPSLVSGFGLLSAMAASIKPTLAPLILATLLVLGLALRRRRLPLRPYLGWGLAGIFAAILINVGFLWRYDAVQAFLFVLRTVTPVYAGLGDPGRRALFLQAIPAVLRPLFLLGAAALVLQWRAWDWERTVLALVTLSGVLSYVLQGKGFLHHRYLFLAFGLLLTGLEVLPARRDWKVRALGFAALLYAAVWVMPSEVRSIQLQPGTDAMAPAMEKDLLILGGDKLQGQVQCFDMILGCLKSLYALDLMENTGFTGDMLLFSRRPNPATTFYQGLYENLQRAHPAKVLVVTNEDFGEPNSFNRLALWPAFAADLAQHYELAATRSFPRQGKRSNEPSAPPDTALAYRIYLRKGESFPSLIDNPQESR